ncbi:hypothetical protein FJV41_01295 [Myxococcus llanfairpwllgwyngyllgogerychwyrndrobwllllantysiliogogogochensis]|uniref:Lipoprotein n=1 Tax=Myxococcus llanfairpwllgwyngyllgogerychwyrndrobwllllantysiliogogogochensis TaxID=2590453 RepID=A0A540X933_9BACT|nr:hypothetical protein [Myxococcus llanfairpwllgwyngyllgogerychwyrndrobwllllantysiliogogogochensis]TQF17811.1 hypothetical protein FJV41_01295 [Myxococcus llanfairpwllgwyngyllgogerychwyrndrobwllllantysiliogogogochensis]
MKKTLLMGLLGALIGIGTSMVSGTAAASEDSLVPCCSDCDAGYDRCMANCQGEDCDLSCFSRWRPCYNVCYHAC